MSYMSLVSQLMECQKKRRADEKLIAVLVDAAGKQPVVPTLDEVMAVYMGSFFVDDDMKGFVAAAKNVEPLVYVSQDTQVTPEYVMQRIPVYYEGPLFDAFDRRRFEKLAGYNVQEALDCARADTFCIAGKASMLGRDDVVIIVHAIGIDLSSRKTPEYQQYITGGTVRLQALRKEIARRMKLWMCAAVLQGERRRVHVRLPLIGMGSCLNAVPQREIHGPLLMAAFADAVIALLPNKMLEIEVCDVGRLLTPALNARLKAAGVVVSAGKVDGDLFKVADAGYEGYSLASNRRLVVVDAWNPHSFIGNAGHWDSTINGPLVAGTGGNAHLRNSSYMHNPIFHPSMGFVRNWVVCEVPPCAI